MRTEKKFPSVFLNGTQANSSGTSKTRDTQGKFENKKEINI